MPCPYTVADFFTPAARQREFPRLLAGEGEGEGDYFRQKSSALLFTGHLVYRLGAGRPGKTLDACAAFISGCRGRVNDSPDGEVPRGGFDLAPLVRNRDGA